MASMCTNHTEKPGLFQKARRQRKENQRTIQPVAPGRSLAGQPVLLLYQKSSLDRLIYQRRNKQESSPGHVCEVHPGSSPQGHG